MRPGDVVVQLGNWHSWTNPRTASRMAFVMMGARFIESHTDQSAARSPAGEVRSSSRAPGGGSVRPVRRIVTIDDESGKSRAIADGPSPDVRTDPARPGFASTRIWVTDRTPARSEPSSKRWERRAHPPTLPTRDILTCSGRAPSTWRSSSTERSRSSSTPWRFLSTPEIPWCSAGPITPGATDRRDQRSLRSRRTTRRRSGHQTATAADQDALFQPIAPESEVFLLPQIGGGV